MNKEKFIKSFVEQVTRKETLSVLVIVVFLGAALCSMFVSPQLYQWGVHEGDIALKDVYAPYNFTYSWEVNEEATSKIREEVAREAPYYLKRDIAGEKNMLDKLGVFFDSLKLAKGTDVPLAEKITTAKESLDREVTEKNIRTLIEYEDLESLENKALGITENIFYVGYIDQDDLSYLKGKSAQKAIIFSDKDAEDERPVGDLLVDSGDIKEAIDVSTKDDASIDRKSKLAFSEVIAFYVTPNLELDEETTEREKQASLNAVKPIYNTWQVEKNEIIIEKGKRVDARHMAQLGEIRRIFKRGSTLAFFFGVLLLLLLLGLIAAINITSIQKTNILESPKEVAIILLSMLFMIVIADFITRSPQPSYFIPMAGTGMMIMLLTSFPLAFLCVVLMGIFISLLVGGGIELMLVLLVGSVVGMLFAKDARRRAQILWAGLLAGVAKFLAIVCIGLINGMQMDFYIKDGIWGIASGVFSGFIVMGALPVFEHLFKVPTNISLLELSDLNHPLLKKLAMEAPGTYHHSIMVGNLAEAACDAIGANSLRARVGAYYHDIGKIPKAEYFAENEMNSGSRHSKLAPSMSALIISKHVKEGIEIANKYKLSKAIVDIIQQHHGDSRMVYFYQKAVEKAEEGNPPKEEAFRYPGPRPQTKETAIILLADSVEASSRALTEPTPSSIRNLVKKIVNNKFIDSQLDECDLTLKDVHVIADSFVRVLTGIFHARPEYPEENDNDNRTPPDDNTGKHKKPKQKSKD